MEHDPWLRAVTSVSSVTGPAPDKQSDDVTSRHVTPGPCFHGNVARYVVTAEHRALQHSSTRTQVKLLPVTMTTGHRHARAVVTE